MKEHDPSPAHADVTHRHLIANASECARRNIIIRVDTVNADRTVAFCSVEQRNRGLLRRTYSQPELVWRAEQALAPLNGLGLLPMINVHMRTDPRTSGPLHTGRSTFTWVQRLRGWLGYPRGIGEPILPGDPFGLFRAMHVPL